MRFYTVRENKQVRADRIRNLLAEQRIIEMFSVMDSTDLDEGKLKMV